MTLQALAPRRERALLLTLAGIQFTHILDFMIMMPLGPQFRQIFSVSDAQFGLLVSAYTLSAGVSGLLASTYLDRFDRKPLLLALYGGFAVSTLACGLADTYAVLMAARVAAGLFGGVLSALSQTIVADVVPFERRGRAMGVVMSAFSAATVAGVPLGLFVANALGWHATFVGIAVLSMGLAASAAFSLPRMGQHVAYGRQQSMWSGVAQVLRDPNHLRAFAFSMLMMGAGFTVIPYITLYLQANVGVQAADVPWVYLAGGAATLVTARVFGRMTDAVGKSRMFARLATLLCLPLLGLTLLPPVPLWAVLTTTTVLFVVMSGRMIPGMALVTAAAHPALRGTFMALNAAAQSAAMGLAALASGALIGRDAHGHIEGYAVAGLVGCSLSLASVVLSRRLRLHTGAPSNTPSEGR